jgi:hypothetical protein
MFGKAIVRGLVATTVMAFAVVAQAVTIDLVPVGNPSNTADGTGYGAVAYNYQIGKFEVTVEQYTAFLNAVAKTDKYSLYGLGGMAGIQRSGSSGSYEYTVLSDWASRPVGNVSWGSVARFANWMANHQPVGLQSLSTTEDGSYYLNGATGTLLTVTRKADATWVIPSENEWYKAAYHKNDGATGNYWDYPTATDNLPSNSLVNPDPGNHANFYNNGYTLGSPSYMTPVGEFEKSASPYGTFDQGGNVWEWTEALNNPNYPNSHLFRGGSFGDVPYYIPFQDTLVSTCRYGDDVVPSGRGSIGFRVGLIPEPGSIVLLLAAAASLLAYAWRRRRQAA